MRGIVGNNPTSRSKDAQLESLWSAVNLTQNAVLCTDVGSGWSSGRYGGLSETCPRAEVLLLTAPNRAAIQVTCSCAQREHSLRQSQPAGRVAPSTVPPSCCWR
jgi:hypothetical protein